jgi:hypothetical protein
VAGELVEEGEQQRRSIERARIVLHPDGVPVEALGAGERLPGSGGAPLETGEECLLLREILLVLEDLSIVPLGVDPVPVEVLGPLVRRGGREDRAVSAGGTILIHD